MENPDGTITFLGKTYKKEYISDALYFYELLQDGSLKEQIKEELKC